MSINQVLAKISFSGNPLGAEWKKFLRTKGTPEDIKQLKINCFQYTMQTLDKRDTKNLCNIRARRSPTLDVKYIKQIKPFYAANISDYCWLKQVLTAIEDGDLDVSVEEADKIVRRTAGILEEIKRVEAWIDTVIVKKKG